jgi:hypothetical protein
VGIANASRSPDAVTEPQRYQEHLIGLVGDDDPAGVQAQTADRIRAFLDAPTEAVRARPEPAEWSVLECVAHILDAEVVYSGRYRWILAHDEPELIGYDQDLWIDRLHSPPEGLEEALALFEPMRRANLALWVRTPTALRGRVGLHRERGPESYGLSFTLVAGHDRLHLGQADRALAAVLATG